MQNFARDLELRVRATYPCLYTVAREDWRCVQEVKRVADNLGIPFDSWTATTGWSFDKNNTDPLEAIKSIKGREGVFTLTNFHRYLDEPEMIQTFKDIVQVGKAVGQSVVLVCNVWKVPPELTDDVTRVDFSLPDASLLGERIDYLLSDEEVAAKVSKPDGEQRDKIIEAMLGMTTWEAENALSLSIVEEGRLDPQLVAREKALAVAKGGLLEFYQPNTSMSDVGGLGNLKLWLAERRGAFSKEAKAFGLPAPRGALLVGVPGCGKSLTAKAIASDWQMPLIRFDLGRLFQGLVGASEENVRIAIATAEAVAPVVLWIDEIEKGMAGMGGSGSTDSGVTARVFGTLLQWMQDRTRPVFVVATANQIQNLPPELMRAGRWDEIFYIDLPSEEERVDILRIHLEKRERDPNDFKLEYIAKESAQFSPAELEQVIIKAMYRAFSLGRALATDDLMDAIQRTVPLAVTRREDIDALRKWAQTRAVPASSATPPKISEEEEEAFVKRKLRFTVEELDE